MRFGLSAETLEKIVKIFSSHNEVSKVLVFGSRAKGNFKPGSDIDLALKGEIKLSQVNSMLEQLTALFLPQTFDLVIYNDIKDSELKEHIDRVGVRLD